LLLPDVLPRLAGVGAAVDAVADLDVAADVGLAGAGVDHIGVGGGDGEGAEGGGGELVGEGVPADAAVGGLPDAGRGGGRVVGGGVGGDAGGAAGASAEGGADVAEGEVLELRRAAPVVGVSDRGEEDGEDGETAHAAPRGGERGA